MSESVIRRKRSGASVKHRAIHTVNQQLVHQHIGIYSRFLKRKVNLDIFHPKRYTMPLKVLLLNDGQDAKLLRLESLLTTRFAQANQADLLVVGIHAGDRIREYGTAGIPDYMGRGNKAQAHLSFVMEELLPFIANEFDAITDKDMAYAGFSLGGLSALDAVWLHPDRFSVAGVFSGSFWWRSRPLNGGYRDSDRIMHRRISQGPFRPGLSFWFQAGTMDETADRNNNGIIDSIDDTLDIIRELRTLGYTDEDILYREVEGGEHNFHTWSEVFPEFLQWAFPPETIPLAQEQ